MKAIAHQNVRSKAAAVVVARTITQLPERAALIGLIIAEATRFPSLVQP